MQDNQFTQCTEMSWSTQLSDLQPPQMRSLPPSIHMTITARILQVFNLLRSGIMHSAGAAVFATTMLLSPLGGRNASSVTILVVGTVQYIRDE